MTLSRLVAAGAALVLVASPALAQDEAGGESDPLAVAEAMVAAWDAIDTDAVANLFAEDGELHSMMLPEPIVGREVLREHIGALLADTTHLELVIRNAAVTGNTVILERVDTFTYRGNEAAVPVVGVLVIEDGLVAEWREYYDRNQLLSAMGLAEPIDYSHATSYEDSPDHPGAEDAPAEETPAEEE